MITFVCGQLCSGKSLYAKALCEISNSDFIEVGDIVRNLKQTQDRKRLQDSKDAFERIATVIENRQKQYPDTDFVISGVRQKEILQRFPDSTLLWIECPSKLREERYKNRNRNGDTMSFQEAEEGDIALGILETKRYILNR